MAMTMLAFINGGIAEVQPVTGTLYIEDVCYKTYTEIIQHYNSTLIKVIDPDFILELVIPNMIHNSFGITIDSNNPAMVKKFTALMMTELQTDRRWFYQGGHNSESWRYFELLMGGCGMEEAAYASKLLTTIALKLWSEDGI